MKAWVRTAVVSVLFVAALPFIVLSAQGVLKPAEGFCYEYVDRRHLAHVEAAPPSAENYFRAPELSADRIRLAAWLSWPICIRSRRAEHYSRAANAERDLGRLGAESLLATDERATRVVRVLTQPSFSRDPIVITLRMSDGGDAEVTARWLIDDEPAASLEIQLDPEAFVAWEGADLPRGEAHRTISAASGEALWRLALGARDLPVVGWVALDGNWLVVEMIDSRRGRRDVRRILLGEGDGADDLFCGLATAGGVPPEVLAYGDVAGHCEQR